MLHATNTHTSLYLKCLKCQFFLKWRVSIVDRKAIIGGDGVLDCTVIRGVSNISCTSEK